MCNLDMLIVGSPIPRFVMPANIAQLLTRPQ